VSDPYLPPLREVIARHGLQATKALGQNFLFDEQLLTRIAAIPGNLRDKAVLEIGPGPGGLTRALLRAGARVTVIEGDALKFDPALLFTEPYAIVANLPYNVGTALFTGWLAGEQWPPQWSSLTLMFQQEVAQRVVAEPGSSSYGRLAVLAQWRSTPKLAMKVHRSAFTPPPKVMSAIIHVVPGVAPAGVSMRKLERLTETAFGQRRKMLRQSLKGLPGALDALAALGIDEQRRAETLSVAEFVSVAREMGRK